MTTLVNEGQWVIGRNFCRLWLFSDFFFCTVSVVNLAFVALDRFKAVKDPIGFSKGKTTRKVRGSKGQGVSSISHLRLLMKVIQQIIFAWFLGLLVTFPTLLAILVDSSVVDYCTCTIVLNNRRWYPVWTSVICFFTPLAAISWLYLNIWCETDKAVKTKRTKHQRRGSNRSGAAKVLR